MPHWKVALAAGLPAAVVVIVFLIVIYYFIRCNEYSKHGHSLEGNPFSSRGNFHQSQDESRSQIKFFTSLHTSRKDSTLRKNSKLASIWRMTYPIRSFDWSEHPSLAAEVVEHGWGAFAFAYTCSTCPVSGYFWDMCISSSHKHEFEPILSWEVGSGSEYMQKLWLNPGMVSEEENALTLFQAMQAALPLPGPASGLCSFPQEAYFEVTILAEGCEYNAGASHNSLVVETDPVKLISERLLAGKNLDSEVPSKFSIEDDESREQKSTKEASKSLKLGEAFHSLASHVEFSKFFVKENPLGENVQVVAVGLAAGGAPPSRLPGCDIGSVGFHSNGCVYLNGLPHAEQGPQVSATKCSWGAVKTTVGCGFDPHAKKISFTVDGELVHELVTSNSEFGNPLYPIVAANYDVTLLINFGQSPFKYALANAHRVSDPCIWRRYPTSLKNGTTIDESGDLFSIQHQHVLSETQSDLFEIALDTYIN